MTYIAEPAITDNHVLNHIARDLIRVGDEPGKTFLRKALRIATEDGVLHELSFNQLDGLLNILDQNRTVIEITPLQYLVQLYNLEEMIELGRTGWEVTEYDIILIQASKTIRFEGKLNSPGFNEKIFKFALGGFDFVQQFSLSRIIAAQNEKLSMVAGTYDMDYRYSYGPEGIKFNSFMEEVPDEA